MNLNKCKTISIPTIKDNRGYISFLQNSNALPFIIRRVYYIYGVPHGNCTRGAHAHKKLNQIMIALMGAVKVSLDDGTQSKEYLLNSPQTGLFISEMIWRDLYDFSDNTVILVLTNMIYKESDYIRNYEQFQDILKK